MLIRHWMQTKVVSVKPETSLLRCKSLIREHNIAQLPVVDNDNRVIGIISNTDIKEFSPQNNTGLEILELLDILAETPVKQIMNKNPWTIRVENTVENAALIMEEKSVSCLPVIDSDKKLEGIITQWDIFKTFINICGIKEQGIQMSFLLEYKPGTLRAKLAKMQEHKARIISVLSNNHPDGMRYVTVRFRATDPVTEERLIKELIDSGGVLCWGKEHDIHTIG